MGKDPSGEYEIPPNYKELYGIDPISRSEYERRMKLCESLPKIPEDLRKLRFGIKQEIINQNKEGYPFDGYQVHGVITGGMGMVLEAWHPDLERKEALKLWMEEDADDKLLREAQTLARLRPHPNIVTVYGIGTWNDRRYIMMEWIDGQTAWDWFKQETRTWREIRDLYVAAGAGLASAHEDDIHHRDFKPSNILVGHDGRVCVIDFGLADTMRSSERLEMIGSADGTTSYMAPERLWGLVGDARSDQFSFCVALWLCLHNQMPYWGENDDALLRSIAGYEIVPGDPHADVPHWLSRIVRKGLHPDPDERYADMRELLAALMDEPADEQFEGDVDAAAFPSEPSGYMHAPVANDIEVVDVSPVSPAPRRRSFGPVTLGVLGGVSGTLLALGAFLALDSDPSPTSSFHLSNIDAVQVISTEHKQWQLGVRRFNQAKNSIESGDFEKAHELWDDGRTRLQNSAPWFAGTASLGLAQRVADTKLDRCSLHAAYLAAGAAKLFQHGEYWGFAKTARTKAAEYFRSAGEAKTAAQQDACAAAHENKQPC